MTTPMDAVPRLVARGMALDDATELARQCPAARLSDVLDALDVLDADRPMRDPVGWATAAVSQEWDLSPVLTQRRENELRLVELRGDEAQVAAAQDGYGARRAIADQWGTAISAALDEEQLSRAVAHLTEPVAGIGIRSVPMVRAELLAWAVAVHESEETAPFAEALAYALDHLSRPDAVPAWPLPPAPDVAGSGDASSLRVRLEHVLDGIDATVTLPRLEQGLEVDA